MMQSNSKAVTVRFTIEIPKGYKYMGTSYAISCNFEMEFTKKEISLVKRFVAAYEHDAETDLMPILEENLPELYQRIDKKARLAMTEFFWREAINRSEEALELERKLQLNYKRDVESGEFVPSKEYKPLFHYDVFEDLAFIEWFERELKCKTNEDCQRYHKRYEENFDGMDVCENEYVCHIPDAFLPKKVKLSRVKCQYNIGVMYCNGLDVPVDYEKAIKWYTKAAEQGLANAQCNLGYMYTEIIDVIDYDAAIKCYTKAAEQGCVEAKHNLGVMYHKGLGVPVDYEKAIKWYTKAAEQGFADSQNNLGCMYVKGEGVPVDYDEARRWFTKAAEQGLPDSQFNLGKMYHLGVGVFVDFETARRWYNKALEQGDTYAIEGLRRLEEAKLNN